MSEVSFAVHLNHHLVVAYYEARKPTEVNVHITCKSGLRGNVLKLYDINEIQDLHTALGQIIQDDDLKMQEILERTPIGKEPF
jgi:hypothetical protein